MLSAMVHPDHGTHLVYTWDERKMCEERGWVYDAKLSKALAEPQARNPASMEDLAAQYEKKFGKKPHHLMKAETIRAELADPA